MKKSPQIIIPVENGFVVFPYDMDTALPVQRMGQVTHVAPDVEQLQKVVGEMFAESDKQRPSTDTEL